MTKRIHVVAAILRDPQGRVLLAQRGAGKHLEGLWEFPGGKVEADETPLAALRRELHEEIGVDVDEAEPLIRVPWTYPEKHVDLDVYDALRWHGVPQGREGQALAWCEPARMHAYAMPPADRPIVAALRLARTMLVTPAPTADLDAWQASIERALARGIGVVQLRVPGASEPTLAALGARIAPEIARREATLVVNGTAALARALGAGLHWPASIARAHAARPVPADTLFGVSVHDAAELAHAQALAADYVVIGPVRETATHPGGAGLGWERFEALARATPLPSFAIGGLAPSDLATACVHGAFGVAGIRAFATAA